MARRGGDKKKNRRKQVSAKKMQETRNNTPITPPPSRRNRPVKKVIKEYVSEEELNHEASEEFTPEQPEEAVESTQTSSPPTPQILKSQSPVIPQKPEESPSVSKKGRRKNVKLVVPEYVEESEEPENQLEESATENEGELGEEPADSTQNEEKAIPESEKPNDQPGKIETGNKGGRRKTVKLVIPITEEEQREEAEEKVDESGEDVLGENEKADSEEVGGKEQPETAPEIASKVDFADDSLPIEVDSSPKEETKDLQAKDAAPEQSEIAPENPNSEENIPAEDTPRPAPARKKRRILRWVAVTIPVLAAIFAGIAYFLPGLLGFGPVEKQENCLGIHPDLRKGLDLSKMSCERFVASRELSLEKVLLAHKVDWKQSLQLVQELSVKKAPLLGVGMVYTFLYRQNDATRPVIFAYEPDPERVVLLTLKGKPEVIVHNRKILEDHYRPVTAIIKNSFAETMFNRESGWDLTQLIYEAMKFKLDLFELSPGDKFDIVYREQVLEGDIKVLKGLVGVHFYKNKRDFYAYYYKDDLVAGYFDEEARPVKSAFLMMPLHFGRLSSPYNLVRRDPVMQDGSILPHLGTDYAAPLGTEILAVADGIVEEATFKHNNGNYVKLIHQQNIKTQYLHMQKFAEGIEPGKFVQQGDVIGYIGMTGRTTGPHVCFRYWKNGVQVDHRKEKHPPARPLMGQRAESFYALRDSIQQLW